jgi:hypothetical protein
LTATAGRKIFLSFTFADMQQELFWRYEILWYSSARGKNYHRMWLRWRFNKILLNVIFGWLAAWVNLIFDNIMKKRFKGWIRTPEYVKALLKTEDWLWLTFTASERENDEKYFYLFALRFVYTVCYSIESRGCEATECLLLRMWRH